MYKSSDKSHLDLHTLRCIHLYQPRKMGYSFCLAMQKMLSRILVQISFDVNFLLQVHKLQLLSRWKCCT